MHHFAHVRAFYGALAQGTGCPVAAAKRDLYRVLSSRPFGEGRHAPEPAPLVASRATADDHRILLGALVGLLAHPDAAPFSVAGPALAPAGSGFIGEHIVRRAA